MRLTIAAYGTRGDAEPFVGLAQGLLEAGHEVRLATFASYASLTEGSAIDFRPIDTPSPQELLQTEQARAVIDASRSPVRVFRQLRELLYPAAEAMYRDTLAALDGVDAVLGFPSNTGMVVVDAAHQLGIPMVQTHLWPGIPTAAFPAPSAFLPTRSLTPWGNRTTYAFDAIVAWLAGGGLVSHGRRHALGLGPLTLPTAIHQPSLRRPGQVGAIVGISPSVLPPPADWPQRTTVTGYWWRDLPTTARALAPETERFLAAGAPPVFLGLGSMRIRDLDRFAAAVVGAASDAGVRLVLQRGWGGLGDGIEAEHVHVLGDTPHDVLFPRVAAVVHHGGAGTTARGLRHGRPTLVLPVNADQRFWGRRVHRLGAGPLPLPERQLTREQLAERLVLLTREDRYARRAGELQRRLAEERGRQIAARAVGELLGG